MTSVKCMDVDLDCKVGSQALGLQAKMVCQKAKNFRLVATVLGNTQADLGSNDQEFWYWIAKAEPPYLVHCSYADLANRARPIELPFPFQPEWVMEALGMAEYDPAGEYVVTNSKGTLQLMQRSVSPQGLPVRKVTVFDARRNARVRVMAHLLQDEQGKEICSAYINDVQVIGGVAVPTKIILRWPAQRLEMKMKLNGPLLNQLDQANTGGYFTRPTIANVQAYDLAHGPDGAATQLSPTGGAVPR